MQTLYVPKYGITYRVNQKNPRELLWSVKPFGPATQWQHAYTFSKPIRALDTDDQTGQGVVVLNDSTTYVGSGVRVWGKKFYTAGSRIYSLYAIGEKKMENKLRIKVHEAYTPHWKADDIDGYVHTLWDQDIVKEVISTRYPDYPEITWKLYDNDGNLITIVSLAQDMLHVMRPGHYYSKSITGWGRAFWQGDQLANIKNLFDEFRVYDYVPTDGHQPKKSESLKTQRKVAIKVHEKWNPDADKHTRNEYRTEMQRIVNPLSKGFFHDTDWNAVWKIRDALKDAFPQVKFEMWADNRAGGYSGNTKTYDFLATTPEGYELFGRIKCFAAGTKEAPFDRYDMTVEIY